MSNEKDKTILELTELTSVDGLNDFIPIVEQSSNETKKVSPSNLPVSAGQQAALDLKANDADLTAHTGDTSNPHSVTATQVGLGNVDNTSDASKPVSTAQQTALDLKADDADLTAHTGDTSNPHSVTAAQVGLGNVDNTSDASKPVSTAQQTALDLKADATALTTETNARIDADNRREFAGGVAKTISNGPLFALNTLNLGFSNFSIFTKINIKSFSARPIWRSNSSGINRVELRIESNGNLAVRFIDASNSSTSYSSGLGSLNLGLNDCLFVFNRNGNLNAYVNGSLIGSVNISSLSTINLSNGNTNNSDIYGIVNDQFFNFAIFNTALTATQAAELYQQGLQPWLAANPQYRRGYLSNLTNTWSLGNSNTDFLSNTSSANQITATANSSAGSSGARLLYTFNNYVAEVGSTITATFNVTSITGGVDIKYMAGQYPSTASSGTLFTINSTGAFVYSHTITQKAYGLIAIFGADEAIDAELTSLTVSGSLATLPLDDDCRQLKDISGNRNDATASESGVTHLKQKDLHAFRDDNADGTGGSYLIANADILAENEVITGVTVDGRFYAASGDQDLTKRRIKLEDHGSHVDVKRSNGTTDDSAIAVTNPSDGTDFAITVLTQRI